MKLLCKKYNNCSETDCLHRKPHHHMNNCDINCDGDGVDGNVSKCVPYIKSVRKEKIKKILDNES